MLQTFTYVSFFHTTTKNAPAPGCASGKTNQVQKSRPGRAHYTVPELTLSSQYLLARLLQPRIGPNLKTTIGFLNLICFPSQFIIIFMQSGILPIDRIDVEFCFSQTVQKS
jgi:hypothetical protein